MHDTSVLSIKRFYNTYYPFLNLENPNIVEIGSQDVNGSLRDFSPSKNYLGLDFVKGKGVDIVLDNPYKIPLFNETADIVVCSSCFEHSEMFWVLFLEILRILKPHGLFYLNAPANGYYHRYPVDCWRFYPDSGRALITWAKYNNINADLLESYVGAQQADNWNDFVGIFIKDSSNISKYPYRILDSISDYENGFVNGSSEIQNFQFTPEDQRNKR